MKNSYEMPYLEVIRFQTEDVITTSGFGDPDMGELPIFPDADVVVLREPQGN